MRSSTFSYTDDILRRLMRIGPRSSKKIASNRSILKRRRPGIMKEKIISLEPFDNDKVAGVSFPVV